MDNVTPTPTVREVFAAGVTPRRRTGGTARLVLLDTTGPAPVRVVHIRPVAPCAGATS